MASKTWTTLNDFKAGCREFVVYGSWPCNSIRLCSGTMKDQSCEEPQVDWYDTTSYWQSFKPSITGPITKIRVYGYSSGFNTLFTIRIREGEGSGGAILAEKNMGIGSSVGWRDCWFAGVNVTAESTYSIELVNSAYPHADLHLYRTTNDLYDRGRSKYSSDTDMAFMVYVNKYVDFGTWTILYQTGLADVQVADWDSISWTANEPGGSDVKMRFAIPGGGWTPYQDIGTIPETLAHEHQILVQVKMTRGDPNFTPEVFDITLTYDVIDEPFIPHAPTIHYVRTDGNDDNDGLSNSSDHAWKTVHHAAISAVASDVIRIVNVNGTPYNITSHVNIWAGDQTWEGIPLISGDIEEYPKILIEGEYDLGSSIYRSVFEVPCYSPYSGENYFVIFKKIHFKVNMIGADFPRGFFGSYWAKFPQYLTYERLIFEGYEKPDPNLALPRAIYAISYDTEVTVKFCVFKWMGYAISSGDYHHELLKATNCIFYENYYDLYAVWADPAIDSDYNFHYITMEEETNNAAYATIGANSHCALNGNEEDPLLVDVDTGDFHLQALSPCIDAADPVDDNGQQGTHWDAGAYELKGAAVTVTGSSMAAKLMAAGLL